VLRAEEGLLMLETVQKSVKSAKIPASQKRAAARQFPRQPRRRVIENDEYWNKKSCRASQPKVGRQEHQARGRSTRMTVVDLPR
jgi:hypothetical protein